MFLFRRSETILQSLAPGEMDTHRFCCSICLNPLKDPVTIGCGHSYCKSCIKTVWDNKSWKRSYSCPQCRQTFLLRPVPVKNTVLADLLEELKKTGLLAAPADHCYAGPEDVACDVCTGRKLKALKSCLVCLASYCENHLQPHFQSPPFKLHKLVNPSEKLEENICSRHNEVKKMFCSTDEQCICYLCSVYEYKAEAERTERPRELGLMRQTIHQRVQDTEKDVKLLQQEEEAVNGSADKAVEDSEEIFTELIHLLEKRSSDVKQQIRSQQETEVSRVRELQKRLEQEITELKKKDHELKQLSDTEDHNKFLHNDPSTHSSSIRIRPLRNFEDVTAAVSQVRGRLQDILSETEFLQIVSQVDVLLPKPETRADFLKYSQEITLDPNTANRHVLLSDGNRKVTHMRQEQSYSYHPDRFTDCCQVLSRESLTGRCYWEVEMGVGPGWGAVGVTVTYKNISRAGDSLECRFGFNDKSWSLSCYRNSYTFHYNSIMTPVSGRRSSRVGVYLDHRAGVLSFYSVSDTMTLIHRVQTTFTQPIYAGVNVHCYGDTAEFCAGQIFTHPPSPKQVCEVMSLLPSAARSETILQSLAPGEMDTHRFCCSICLDPLKDPVTIGCGHSYCKSCIKTVWDKNSWKRSYSCPQCRQTFLLRPVLVKNTVLADLLEELKKTGLLAAPADHCYAGPEDVACDVCTGRKRKSLKSCLVCLASYCEKHLQPHFQSPPFKKHKLVEPSEKLQENICSRHDEVMKMFCRTDEQCICYLCSVYEYKAEAERTERQRELGLRRQTVQQRVQDTEKDVKLLQLEEEAVNGSADKAVEDSEEIFTELIRLLEKRSSDVKQQIRSQHETEVRRVRELQKRLEQEITELKRKDHELKQLSDTEDHNQFLHNYPSLSPLSESTHSSSIRIHPLRYFEDVTAAVSQVRGRLQDILSVLLPQPETRADFLKYSQEITLDRNTAHRGLLLSEGNRKARRMREEQSYSYHQDRFTDCCQVLSRESLTGRCYWEVEVKVRGAVGVAVTYKNISRAGDSHECGFGYNDKSWSLSCYRNSYTFHYNSMKTPVSGRVSSRVGVYLDHSAGVLSFYSVSDTMTLLHRVQTTFTQPLCAGVSFCYGDTAVVF
ncbi:E3 ubiquitin/ISG15 ligase TRIM25-like [Limanda limanda]|uniref:E3 ubiquitin/ISG15 ligase TRIM25-like n=1 Tax=Limanda limanda TaxID=27771 RepID=UPI0029C6CDC9|nr:E3 ubiquitin/ISG15 ligase TRIM25-like [Limanda limanda]